MTVHKQLANVVDRARRHQGMTVRDVAHTAQVDDGTVRRLLAGDTVRISTIRLVLDAVELRWEDVVRTLADSTPPPRVGA